MWLPVPLWGSKLRVASCREGNADNAAGMSEQVKPYLQSYQTCRQRTGMGMAISYQIITEKHGGKLECFSIPGEGSEFIIQLPTQQQVSPAV